MDDVRRLAHIGGGYPFLLSRIFLSRGSTKLCRLMTSAATAAAAIATITRTCVHHRSCCTRRVFCFVFDTVILRVFCHSQLWAALEYFLDRVVPVAEECGVYLAMHPDDPPLPEIRGCARIMTSPEAFERLITINKSPHNGITFCQVRHGVFTRL